LLFTDIEGSTRLLDRLGAGTGICFVCIIVLCGRRSGFPVAS
jgi:hypothetical protein